MNDPEEKEPLHPRLDLVANLYAVRKFFTDLEDGTAEGDPLRQIRARFHAPVLRHLDEAIRLASVLRFPQEIEAVIRDAAKGGGV